MGDKDSIIAVLKDEIVVLKQDNHEAERQIAELREERDANPRWKSKAEELAVELVAAESEIARLKALPLKDEVERAARYAESLAETLWEKHWKDDSPGWKPLSGNLVGLLTQIDNMTAGLSRQQAGVQEGWRSIKTAPKDGTKILYITKFDDIGFCYWDEGYNEDDEPFWWDNERDDAVCPIAWLPADTLPASPSVSEGGRCNG